MFFGIFGGSEARRHPWHFPWIEATVWTVAILLIAGIVVGGLALTTNLFSGSDQVEPRQAEEVDTAPAVVENPPAQTESEGTCMTQKLPLVQVAWTQQDLRGVRFREWIRRFRGDTLL